jgi:hypothetical protein
MIYEFWTSDEFHDVAIGISGNPTVRFQILHEKNARLLFRKEFDSIEKFRKFHDYFLFEGGKSEFTLLNVPASEYRLNKYPCGLSAGDIIELKSGFIQDMEYQRHNFSKRVGWRFTVLTGDKDYPNVIWLETHKEGSQQKYFPILEENIKRFKIVVDS